MRRRFEIFKGVLSIVTDLALVVVLVWSVLVERYELATLAVLMLILFELTRIRDELRRQRPRAVEIHNVGVYR